MRLFGLEKGRWGLNHGGMFRDYTKIQAWKLADDLAVAMYTATKNFPRQELFGMTSQLRRAAYSVASNIVEGASRGSKKDYLHFLHIARGSLNETHYFVHLSGGLEYLSSAQTTQLLTQTRRVLACLQGLIRFVEKDLLGDK